jgi:acetoin utilization deacetylase AcuC-like enzyme
MILPIVYHPDYVVSLPDEHRFPMAKFRLLYEMILRENIAQEKQFFQPQKPHPSIIELVHERSYIENYLQGTLDYKAQRKIGLPWSKELVNRTCIAVGGTILTAKLALKHGLACNTAGGTHHAFPSYGSGFCIFNDLAIAASLLLVENLVEKILIVDLDVHQGDGTAYIFKNNSNVFTFSMHCEANFPGVKQTSDLDLPLAVGMEDEEYLQILGKYLPELLTQVQPDLVLYDAGVDPHHGDRLGKLALTDTGLFRREMQVLTTCIAAGYPVACVIGGGYADDINALVYRHSLIHRAAKKVYHQHKL